MPRSETILTVFVASPGDVAEERAALEEVIRELNSTWSRTLGLRLELIRWETNAYPGFGEDPQDVVNQQIRDDYDIFIGVMWARYGTPTKRSGSGTEEEFYRAFNRYKERGNVRIMFYFKDAPISPSKLDPEQLHAVSKFKDQLGNKGGLYWEFTTLGEFQSFVRVHLSRVVQEWNKCKQEGFKDQQNELLGKETQIIIDANGEELGFLDYIEMSNDSFLKLNETILRINQYQIDLNKTINQHTEELKRIPDLPPPVRMSTIKHIFQKSAEDMEEFGARIDVEIPIYSKTFEEAFLAFSNLITLSVEYGTSNKDEVNEALKAISSLILSMPNTIESIKGLRSSIGSLPLMISRQNVAKRKTINTLNNLVREFETGLNLAIEVEKALKMKLSDPECN